MQPLHTNCMPSADTEAPVCTPPDVVQDADPAPAPAAAAAAAPSNAPSADAPQAAASVPAATPTSPLTPEASDSQTGSPTPPPPTPPPTQPPLGLARPPADVQRVSSSPSPPPPVPPAGFFFGQGTPGTPTAAAAAAATPATPESAASPRGDSECIDVDGAAADLFGVERGHSSQMGSDDSSTVHFVADPFAADELPSPTPPCAGAAAAAAAALASPPAVVYESVAVASETCSVTTTVTAAAAGATTATTTATTTTTTTTSFASVTADAAMVAHPQAAAPPPLPPAPKVRLPYVKSFDIDSYNANAVNEDRSVVDVRHADYHLFCVFDGHGGPECSQFAEAQVADAVLRERRKCGGAGALGREAWHRVLASSLTTIDSDFHNQMAREYPTRGSCAIVCVVVEDKVYTACIGDSRAVLCRIVRCPKTNELQAQGIPLSCDQDCQNKSEVAAVRARTSDPDPIRRGRPFAEAPLRVAGSLMVTRALGDSYLKHRAYSWPPFSLNTPYICSDPIVTEVQLEECDAACDFGVVLASDGLYNFMSNDEIAYTAYMHKDRGASSTECGGRATPPPVSHHGRGGAPLYTKVDNCKGPSQVLVMATLEKAAKKKGISLSMLLEIGSPTRRTIHDDITVIFVATGSNDMHARLKHGDVWLSEATRRGRERREQLSQLSSDNGSDCGDMKRDPSTILIDDQPSTSQPRGASRPSLSTPLRGFSAASMSSSSSSSSSSAAGGGGGGGGGGGTYSAFLKRARARSSKPSPPPPTPQGKPPVVPVTSPPQGNNGNNKRKSASAAAAPKKPRMVINLKTPSPVPPPPKKKPQA